DGVHGRFKGDDMRSSLMQRGAGFLAASLPTGALPELTQMTPEFLREVQQDPVHALFWATPEMREARLKEQKKGEQQAVEAAPGAAVADVTAPLFAGGAAERAGALAAMTLPDLLTAQQNDQHSAF